MTLPELCNSNEKAPIRFALTDYKNRVFNVFQTTVHQLRNTRTLQAAKAESLLHFDKFEVY